MYMQRQCFPRFTDNQNRQSVPNVAIYNNHKIDYEATKFNAIKWKLGSLHLCRLLFCIRYVQLCTTRRFTV